MRRFDRFLAALAKAEVSSRAYNPYSSIAGDGRANAIRRRNLRRYFEEISAIGPRTLLVGEAPSHRGARLTGIAFVSETIMLDGVELGGVRILGGDRGYRKATTGSIRSTEASATMVWETIRAIEPLPLLWNAFPFHPFVHGNPLSNRAPIADELRLGEKFLAWLIRLFEIEQVTAVGNHAGASLARLGIEHVRVRHPSQGGKRKFVEGMQRVASTRSANAHSNSI
ncbi:MAG TPA: uracil-DNA glycosylase [Thermoanaerobaculia bacterium]|nr:uracil-DNA glycosylase [Thermoanaerobaculia bacterium]